MNSVLLSQHNSLVMVVDSALGGGKGKGAPMKPGKDGVKDLAAGHTDVHAAVAAINAAMRL